MDALYRFVKGKGEYGKRKTVVTKNDLVLVRDNNSFKNINSLKKINNFSATDTRYNTRKILEFDNQSVTISETVTELKLKEDKLSYKNENNDNPTIDLTKYKNVQPDWNQTDAKKGDFIKNKPEIPVQQKIPEYSYSIEGKNLIVKKDGLNLVSLDLGGIAGGSTAVNLSYVASQKQGELVSSNGSNAIIPLATSTNAGLQRSNFYKEGQWKPEFGSYGFSYNVGSYQCNYVKIGKVVHFSLLLKDITTPTNTVKDLTQTFYIGLPFKRDLEAQPTSSFTINVFYLGEGGTTLPSDNIHAFVGNIGLGSHILFRYDIFTKPKNLGKLTINKGTIQVTGSYFIEEEV